jgi:parallel beta-helix repeat protein
LKETVSGIMLSLLLINTLMLAFSIQPVKAASGTIYIRADGSVNPSTAPIQRDGEIYTLTDNVYDEVVVERSNITIDGNGYVLQGSQAGYGFSLSSVNGVIIRNVTISNFDYGIYFKYSSNNIIAGNHITANKYGGIRLDLPSNNTISGNNIRANYWWGVYLYYSSYHSIVENNIENNEYGVYLHSSSCNVFNWNNLVDNQFQAYIYGTSVNVWDDGYPSGGNYWSDYTGIDEKWGPNQDLLGSDGIGDIPYVIDANNIDRYSLKKPYPWDSHDVGITAVNISKTVVGQGSNVSTNVMLFNYWNNVETLNITLYANTTILDKITNITLLNRNFTIVTFTWNTSGFVKGNYTLWAYVETVEGETNTTDNACTGDWVVVTILGDVDGNFEVDINDLTAICLCYDSEIGDSNYRSNYDIDSNGIIDIFDVTTACITYGQKYP